MKTTVKHIAVCVAMVLISAALECTAYLNYDSLRANPVILGSHMAIAPVYNMDGSWPHGRWEIGYNGLLLSLENIIALFAAVYFFRMIASYDIFFGLSERWLYIVDLEIAVPIYRMLGRLYRPYTLDYLYIRGYGTFDFPDFCIGTGIAGILLWMIPAICVYYRYKKEQTAGMGFMEKIKWELRMSGRILSLPFVRRGRWEERFDRWREV